MKLLGRVAVFAFFGLTLTTIISAVAAANTVPASNLSDSSRPITPNDLKPSYCTMTITNPSLVLDGNGTSLNDLVLGTAGADTGATALKGAQGDDCILGGAGNDTINGGPGTGDVCDGGPGSDTFVGCETRLNDP